MDRQHYEDRWDTEPGVKTVWLYPLIDGTYDRDRGIEVGAAEQAAIEVDDESLFDGISTDLNRCLWWLWMPTFRAEWDKKFAPVMVRLESRWLVRDGNDLWSIQGPTRLLTRWRCPSIELIGRKLP